MCVGVSASVTHRSRGRKTHNIIIILCLLSCRFDRRSIHIIFILPRVKIYSYCPILFVFFFFFHRHFYYYLFVSHTSFVFNFLYTINNILLLLLLYTLYVYYIIVSVIFSLEFTIVIVMLL